MKTCKAPGCRYPVFSHGYCRVHQWMRKDEKHLMKASKQRSRKKWANIPSVSKKRSKQLKSYSELCEEMDKRAVANKEYVCFFCGGEVEGRADHHHLNGKENQRLTNDKYLVLAHRKCHSDYHSLSVEKLMKKDWYEGFLDRLLTKSRFLYRKEIIKQEKAGLI